MSSKSSVGSSEQNSFERFAAGEDRLAALLRAVPVFEAPADMTLRFAERARAAQALQASLSAGTVQVVPMAFEPPASLEAGFLAEAARLQAAQQPRHDAVIEQIQAGKSAAEVLGHDVSEATTKWLESRPERIAAKAATAPTRSTSSKWWQRFGVLVASAFFGSVATNLWLAQRGEAPTTTAMTETSSAKRSAEPALPPAVELKVEPIAQISALSKPASPPPGESKQAVMQRLQQYAETRRAMKAEAELGENASTDKADRADQRFMRDQVKEQELALERRTEQQRETLAGASAKMAPGAGLGVVAPSAAPGVLAPSEERMNASQAAPAVAGAVARERRMAARAPAAAAPAPAPPPPMAKAAAEQSSALRVSLSSAPQDVAKNWQASGNTQTPRIFALSPEDVAVRSWAERFRQALPAEMRPAQMKIEQDGRLREDALRIE